MRDMCQAESQLGDHLYTTVYTRPWRRCFRKTFWLRCWKCDLRIEDPRPSCRKVGHDWVKIYGDLRIAVGTDEICIKCKKPNHHWSILDED
jgi:predicted amidophosphoribosyltransferase